MTRSPAGPLPLVLARCVDSPEPLRHPGYVRSRAKGMWWGTALEAPGPAGLARFCSELLGGSLAHDEPGSAVLAAPEGPISIDFQVGDLDTAVADAVALGATAAEHQPQDNVRVLLDPAGHPFCLCREQD